MKRLHFFWIIPALLALAACDSMEDFADADIRSDIRGGLRGETELEPTDPASFRIVGVLMGEGPISNIGYRCGEFRGFTGQEGIEDRERDNHYFVCPAEARKVTFFLGGKDDQLIDENEAQLENELVIGSAYFECESGESGTNPGGELGCNQVKKVGAYEKDEDTPLPPDMSELPRPTPYLFSLTDLIDSPSREDVELHDAHDDDLEHISGERRRDIQRLARYAALIKVLDYRPDADFMRIHDGALNLIGNQENADEGLIAPLLENETLELADFIDSQELGLFLEQVEAGNGEYGYLPSVDDVVEMVREGDRATAAGIYRAELISMFSAIMRIVTREEDAGLVESDDFVATDTLIQELSDSSLDPSDDENFDATLRQVLEEFFPYVIVDRHGRTLGAGAFDHVQYTGDLFEQSEDPEEEDPLDDFDDFGELFSSHCDDRLPDYLTLDRKAAFAGDWRLRDFSWSSILEQDSDPVLRGRMLQGWGYHGREQPQVGRSDYREAYPFAEAYDFDPERDEVFLEGFLCGMEIDSGNVIQSFHRAGLVEPRLPAVLMDYFETSEGGREYILVYRAREDRDADEFEEVVNDGDHVELPIVIHRDGTVLTNLEDGHATGHAYNPDDPDIIPAGQHLLGMVTSVTVGDVWPDDPDEARFNLMLFNTDAPDVPFFGTRSRMQLVPAAADTNECEVMFEPGSWDSEEPGQARRALWFNAYEALEGLREAGPDEVARYDVVRTRTYGQVRGTVGDCTP